MRRYIIASLLALAPTLFSAETSARSWSDLAQAVRPEWTIRVVLSDGTTVEGKPARFEPEALSMRVVRTSNKRLHPKGEINIPRAQVNVVGIRENRHKGRRIGALVPVAAGLAIATSIAASSTGDCREWVCGIATAAGVGIGLGVAVVGGTAGYFIGRAVDRRFQTFVVAVP